MSKFKLNDFTLNEETRKATEMRISKLDAAQAPTVKEFEMGAIRQAGSNEYSTVKNKYGPLAVTDVERASRDQKDRRFSLNPLLRDPLSVEQEESRVIEQKVRVQITEMANAAQATASKLGYEEGFKKGFDEAFLKTKSDGAENLKRFDELVAAAEGAKDEIFRANERFLIEIVFRIAKTILLKELNVDKDALLRLMKELISKVGVRDHLSMKISPEDAQTIDFLKEGLQKAYGEMKNLHIEASTHISRGGCKIETEWNAIDASVETQLQGIYEALIGNNPRSTA
jgi:flagellar biosynthesis/type III secretory pathway protein FliH